MSSKNHGSCVVVANKNAFQDQTENKHEYAKKKPNLKAEAAYENAHLVAQDLVARIGELLFDMPAPGNDEHPIHWGHVGDINEINSRLSHIIDFLSGNVK